MEDGAMRIKVAYLFAVAMSLGVPQVAYAADLPVKAPAFVAPVAAAPIWTGFYVGANLGYGWNNRTDVVANETFAGAPFISGTWPGSGSFGSRNMSGGFGGIQAGYNWQNGSFVFGPEADIQWSGIKGSSAATLPYISAGNTITVNTSGSLNWFGTLRGRAGVAFDRALIYATGGFAFGNPKYSMTMTDTFAFTAAGSSNSNSTGWVLGGGLEYMLMPQWSLKGEYQYLHFGTNTINATEFLAGAATAFAVNTSSTSNFHTVRVGLNYHF
jgi:outer membrane immunogenic protein